MRIRWFPSRTDTRPAARRESLQGHPVLAARESRAQLQLRAAVMSVIEPLAGRRLLSGSIDGVTGEGPSASGEGPTAPPADVTPPVSRIFVDSLYEPGGTSHSVTVTYDDEAGHVDAATIDTEDVVLRKGGRTFIPTHV